MCKRRRKIKERYYLLGHKRCHYCCAQLNYASGYKNSATIEHIVPKVMGGTLAQVNCLVVCQECNSKRGSKSFKRFVSKLPRKEWLIGKYNKALEHYSKRSTYG